MQYSDTLPEIRKPPTVGDHGAPRPATVQCAICETAIPADDAIMSEQIDPDRHTWYTEHLCAGCADPADVLLDRLLRDEMARGVTS